MSAKPFAPVSAYESEKPAPPDLVILSAADFAGKPVPSREWLAEDFIPQRTVTMLGGDGGVGKSLLGKQLGVAVATGGYWAGRPIERGSCLYVACEDDIDEIHRRLFDIAASAQVSIGDLSGLSIVPLVGKDAALATGDGKTSMLKRTALYDALWRALDQIPYDLVILDTLADLFAGEENSRSQARQFIGMLKRLCVEFGCTIVLLAHPSLTGMSSGSGLSGSTAWNNSVRSRLYLDRVKADGDEESDPDLRILKAVKANYSKAGESIKLRWQNGCFVPATSNGGSLEAMAADHRVDRVFLSLLVAFNAEGRAVSHSPAPNYAPAQFARDHRREGVGKRAFEASMGRLFAAGKIRNEESGPPSRRRSRIVVA